VSTLGGRTTDTTKAVPHHLAVCFSGISFCAICGSLVDLCDKVHGQSEPIGICMGHAI